MDNNNQTQFNQGVAPINYPQQPVTPTPKHNSKRIFIIVAIVSAIAVLITAIIAAVVIINSNNDEEIERIDVSLLEKETPTLKLYEQIPQEDIPLSELQLIIDNTNTGAIMDVEDGLGTIKIPNSEDAIYFYIDQPQVDETTGLTDEVSESYNPTDTAYYFAYLRDIGNEEMIGVSYIDDEMGYEVKDGNKTYYMPSKSEAIEAYLAP